MKTMIFSILVLMLTIFSQAQVYYDQPVRSNFVQTYIGTVGNIGNIVLVEYTTHLNINFVETFGNVDFTRGYGDNGLLDGSYIFDLPFFDGTITKVKLFFYSDGSMHGWVLSGYGNPEYWGHVIVGQKSHDADTIGN